MTDWLSLCVLVPVRPVLLQTETVVFEETLLLTASSSFSLDFIIFSKTWAPVPKTLASEVTSDP